MTEDEAKAKWCPRAKEGDYRNITLASGDAGVVRHAFCIGSACMAWRSEALFVDIIGTPGASATPPSIQFAGIHGWCGLAGRP